MRDSAAARSDGDGSASISKRESQRPFTPSIYAIAFKVLKPEHGVCSWAHRRELTREGVE